MEGGNSESPTPIQRMTSDLGLNGQVQLSLFQVQGLLLVV